jgi:hypothetical protein
MKIELNEITKEILTDDGNTFTLSEIKEINEIVENSIASKYFYVDTQSYTRRSFLVVDKNYIDDIYYDWLVDLVDDCYLNGTNDLIKNYFDYTKFVNDCRISDGYAHTFNSYDGSTELETSDYYIYYHN